MIYTILISSEETPSGEFAIEATVELLSDDNPGFDIPNGPHGLKLAQFAAEDAAELRLDVIDARVREWLRSEFNIES